MLKTDNTQNDINNSKLRSFKARFFPSKELKQILAKSFGGARFTYNLCVKNKIDPNIVSAEKTRDQYVTKIINEYNFLKDTPKEIRAFEITEYYKNFNNAHNQYKKQVNKNEYCSQKYQHYKKKNIKKPVLNYKKKKSDQSITINKDAVKIENKKMIIYQNIFGKKPIKFHKSKKDKKLNSVLNSTIFHDIKIIKTRTNNYYICFLVDVIEKPKKQEIKLCTIDTGGRTMATVYDEEQILEMGSNISDDITKMIDIKDKARKEYIEQMKKIRSTKRTNKEYGKIKKDFIEKKNKYLRIEEKIGNRINDFHYKTIKKLMEYSIIHIPKLNVKKIMSKEGNLHKNGKRYFQTEKHGLFIKRLEEKAEIEGVDVKIIKEYLTTQTCSNCFNRQTINGGKIFKCENCKCVMDRDHNASKNIYIQSIESKIIERLY
jgi:putative transposase